MAIRAPEFAAVKDRPEFLRALDRAIHGNSQAGEEVLASIVRPAPEG